MTVIAEDNFCITNSRGEGLTSTIFITNKFTFEVTDSFGIRQFFKTLLKTELLQRAFKRGVRSVLAHRCQQHRVYSQYLPCGTHAHYLPCGTHNMHLPCGTHDHHLHHQHMLCGTHERGLQQHLPCGTGKSESDNASKAETPVATQQTGAILTYELREHVLNKVRVLKIAGRDTGIRALFVNNLNCRGYGQANTKTI